MNHAVIYKNYVIRPTSQQLANTGRWSLNLHISTKNEEKISYFYAADEYATQEEATAHCINYGQQIIDGEIPGLSVG
jgi:hypothetical protein